MRLSSEGVEKVRDGDSHPESCCRREFGICCNPKHFYSTSTCVCVHVMLAILIICLCVGLACIALAITCVIKHDFLDSPSCTILWIFGSMVIVCIGFACCIAWNCPD